MSTFQSVITPAIPGAKPPVAANTVFAGPSSGSKAVPKFRSLIYADLPITSLNAPASTGSNITLTNPLAANQVIQFSAGSLKLILPVMNISGTSPPVGFTLSVYNIGSNTFTIVAQDTTTVLATVSPGFEASLLLTSSASANGTWQSSLEVPTSGTQNLFLATPNGSTGSPTLRSIVGADLPNPSASTLGGIQSITSLANNWISYIDTSGVPHQSQPAFSNISGQNTLAQLPNISAISVLANITGSSATPTAVTGSQVLDLVAATVGNLLYRGASNWTGLAPAAASSGYILQSGGSGGSPSWLQYSTIPVSSFSAATANIAMGGFTITGASNPISAQDVATKAYVDNMAVTGAHGYGEAAALINSNKSISAPGTLSDGTFTVDGFTLTTSSATTSGNVLTFASTTGVLAGMSVIGTNIPADAVVTATTGTTITLNVSVGGTGVAISATIQIGEIILLTGQTTTSQNGLWVYTGSGTALVRPPGGDFASGTTINNGYYVFIGNGTTFGLTGWIMVASSGTFVTIDTTGQSWSQFSGAGSGYITSATAPLNVTSGVISINTNGITNSLLAQAGSYTLKGNNTGSTANETDMSISSALDMIGAGSAPAQGAVLYKGSSGWAALATSGTSGYVLTSGGPGANPSWTSPGGGGTVTSITVTVPSFLAVSPATITTNGTFAITLSNASANTIFAGPTSGGSTTPTFRSLVTADIGANIVALTSISTIAANTLLGNSTGSTANVTAITLGATLAFTGGSIYTVALSGDITTSANSFVTTLATVNSNVGTLGTSGQVPVVTVNNKGLTTAVTLIAPISQPLVTLYGGL